jgi:hypothetical protein
LKQLFIVIVLFAAFAGCGTGDEKRVRATIAADLRAFESQDWNAACDLRTVAGRRELVRSSLRPDAQACADAWTPASSGNEPIVTFRFEPSPRQLSDIDVDNDVARVRYNDGSLQRLRKIGGRWLIDAGERIAAR